MRYSPILILHICAGTAGFLSGMAASFFRKGSSRHAWAGNVFVVSMLSLAASGVYLAVIKSQIGNILGGTLTFYLVATAWMTARRRGGKPEIFDWIGLLMILLVGITEIAFGIQALRSETGMAHGYPPWPYFMLGSVAVFAIAGDIRMLVRGGIAGTQRIARHLWRMCFAFFVASASIFLARQNLFPAVLRKTGVLALLTFFPLLLMAFWLVRVCFKSVYGKMLAARKEEGCPIQPAHALQHRVQAGRP